MGRKQVSYLLALSKESKSRERYLSVSKPPKLQTQLFPSSFFLADVATAKFEDVKSIHGTAEDDVE